MKKDCKKKYEEIVHYVERLNQQMKNGVFEERFYLRQIAKGMNDSKDDCYYDYEFVDNEDSKRNFKRRYWLSKCEEENSYATVQHQIALDCNDFIAESDFWEKYYNASIKRNVI